MLTSLGAFENRQSIPQEPSNEPHLILLQHVLQHCWTILAKEISFHEAFVSANSTSQSAESQNASGSLSDNSVSYEVKDLDTDEDEKKGNFEACWLGHKKSWGHCQCESPDNNLMTEFTDMEASFSKTILLSMFKAFGNDIKNSDDGKYYFFAQ